MNELILDVAAMKKRVKELLNVDVADAKLIFLYKPSGNTPQECTIIGSSERLCQPVWKFVQDGDVKYLNVIGGDINRDKDEFLQEHEMHSGYAFRKGDVRLCAVRGWKNNSYGIFLIEGEVKNAVQHIYRP